MSGIIFLVIALISKGYNCGDQFSEWQNGITFQVEVDKVDSLVTCMHIVILMLFMFLGS